MRKLVNFSYSVFLKITFETSYRDGNFKLVLSYFGTHGLRYDKSWRSSTFLAKENCVVASESWLRIFLKASWACVVRYVQEPITQEHASTIGVCDNCPPLKEVINTPWPQLDRDQEAWVGGDTWHQSGALSKGQRGVMQGSVSCRMCFPEI